MEFGRIVPQINAQIAAIWRVYIQSLPGAYAALSASS